MCISCNIIHCTCVLSISGNNVLEKSDLQPALKALKDRLMAKNVVCVYSVGVHLIYLIDILFLSV
jgi:hypothetical protein